MFMVLRKNLYGHPAAGRIWEKERNKVLLDMFNKDGWTCKRSRKDPCMFLIKKGKVKTWAVIWTDDVDMVGEQEQVLKEIYRKINATWECKLTDPEYMLGVKREIKKKEMK